MTTAKISKTGKIQTNPDSVFARCLDQWVVVVRADGDWLTVTDETGNPIADEVHAKNCD